MIGVYLASGAAVHIHILIECQNQSKSDHFSDPVCKPHKQKWVHIRLEVGSHMNWQDSIASTCVIMCKCFTNIKICLACSPKTFCDFFSFGFGGGSA